MNLKLYNTATRIATKERHDKKEGTDVCNVHDHNFCYFKRDEFERLI